MNNLPKLGLPITVLLFVILIFLFRSAVNIGYGEAGVVWKRFGGGTVVDKPALSEGFHIISPWNKVYIYNIKKQEEFENSFIMEANGERLLFEQMETIIDRYAVRINGQNLLLGWAHICWTFFGTYFKNYFNRNF